MTERRPIVKARGFTRRACYRSHPCYHCAGTIPKGAPALMVRMNGGARQRVYICNGCLVNRGGPSLRLHIAVGLWERVRNLTLDLRWLDPADPFAEDEQC